MSVHKRKILTDFGGESANECICIFFTMAKANKPLERVKFSENGIYKFEGDSNSGILYNRQNQ